MSNVEGLTTALADKADSKDLVDTGATAVTVVGSGNGVTSASYNATNRTLTLTKGSTFLTRVPTASSTTLGLVKTGYTASGKNYPVELSNENKMYVNVPWQNTQDGNDNQTVKVGSTTFGINDAVEIKAGTNVTVSANSTSKTITISATDTTYGTATSDTAGLIKIGYTTSGKNYPVQLDGGKAYVNVPWQNTQDGNDNQTIKVGTTTFGANDVIEIATSGAASV